jgi:anti-sigma factor RsiW
MTVDSFSDKLSAYIDGDLPEADRAEMEEMISEFPACSAMFKNMMILQERLGNLPELQPSAEFEFGLRSQILLEAAKETLLRHKVKQVFFPTVGRSILSGAVAAMLVIGVTVLLQGDLKNDVSASRVPAEAELVPAGAQLDPALSVDRGALKQLSKQESYALSRRLYRARTDSPLSNSTTNPRTRPVVQQGKARPVPVSF